MDGPLDDTLPARRPITARDLLSFTFRFGMTMEMFTTPVPWPVVEAPEALDLSTIGPPNPDVQPAPDQWIANLGTLPRLGWRFRFLVARRPQLRPGGDGTDPAHVRKPGPAGGALRHPGRRVPGSGLKARPPGRHWGTNRGFGLFCLVG